MRDYDYIKRTKGQEAADAFLAHKSGKKDSTKELTIKDINTARDTLTETVENFDQLPAKEQFRQAKLFASSKEVPEVETYEEPSTGAIGSLFGMSDTKYRIKGSQPEAKKEDNKTPKEKEKKPKRAWEKYNY